MHKHNTSTSATDSAVQVSVETITPEVAAEWLDDNYRNNRSVNAMRVEAYAKDMAEGNWRMTGEAIKFSDLMVLIDGQHRLHAIVKADIPVEIVVMRGLPQESIVNMDTAMPRSLRNVLEFMSYDNPSELARALSQAWVYEAYMEDKVLTDSGTIREQVVMRDAQNKKSYRRYSNNLFTRTAALELLDRRESLMDSVKAMKPHCHGRQSQDVNAAVGTVALMHNIATTVDEGASVIEFVELVRAGEGFNTDVTFQLNRILARAGTDRAADQMLPYVKDALWFRGYQAYMEGTTGKLRRPKLNSYPTIPGDVEWYAAGQ